MSLSIPILNKIQLRKLTELSDRIDQLEQKSLLYNNLNIIVAENALLKNRISTLESQLSAVKKKKAAAKKKTRDTGSKGETVWSIVKRGR